MLEDVARRWWVLVLRGTVAILFAIAAVIWPGLTVAILIILFGAFSLVNGVVTIVGAFLLLRRDQYWWLGLLDGLVSLAIGLVAVLWPRLTALALAYLIAAFAIVTGVLQLVTAVRLRREVTGEWLLALCGILSIVLGVLIALFPRTGALAIIYLIALNAFIFGVLLIALGFKVRGLAGQPRAYAGV